MESLDGRGRRIVAPFPMLRENGSQWPSLRVVTPSFCQAEYIEETIRSVLLQGYPRLEYFVIDGGSKDGTVEIIKKYSPWLSDWRSEPDKGQVDAIKKGLAGTKTDYFTWLNSDDLFEPNSLQIFAYANEGRAVAGIVRNFLEGTVVESKKKRRSQFGDVHEALVAGHLPPTRCLLAVLSFFTECIG